MLTMNQAKQVVQEVYNTYCGFECSLPADLLFSYAGNVRHNGWTTADLHLAFKANLSKEV